MNGFDSVFDKLEELRKVSSRKGKERLLGKYLEEDPIFKEALQIALDYRFVSNINDVGEFCQVDDEIHTGGVLLWILYDFYEKQSVTNKDKQELIRKFSGSRKTWEVLKRIVNGDLRCGVSAKTLNKVGGNLVPVVPYQRCSTISKIDNISYPAIVQEKADGMFVYFSNKFKYPITRKGRAIPITATCTKEAAKVCGCIHTMMVHLPVVLMGEMVVYDELGKPLPRKTSNGILNSLIKGGTVDTDTLNRIMYIVWDVIPYGCFEEGTSRIPYCSRLDVLEWALGIKDYSRISLIPYANVDYREDAFEFYNRMREQGKEGAVLKDRTAVWKDNTSTKMVKIKNQSTAEFEILDVVEGKGRLSGRMGALVIGTSDRGIICNVGTGFTDDERNLDYWRKHVGDIISVNFESVITDKKTGKKKLFLPVFNETRFEEKSVADDTNYVENL